MLLLIHESVSMGRLKVACAEKVGRPRAEMSGGGGSRPSLVDNVLVMARAVAQAVSIGAMASYESG